MLRVLFAKIETVLYDVNMPATTIPTGPTGARVARKVRELRELRGFTLAELAQETAKVGFPTSISILFRIEEGQPRRRVDTDTLMALALALRVSPLALLLPADDDGPVQITEQIALPFADAWKWATGEAPRPEDARSPAAVHEWLQLSRPHETQRERSTRWAALVEQP